MKITIDTKEDSYEEIRKIIKMLSSLIGEKEVMTNQPEINEQKTGDAFSSMFGDELKGDKQEEAVDVPKIVEY